MGEPTLEAREDGGFFVLPRADDEGEPELLGVGLVGAGEGAHFVGGERIGVEPGRQLFAG